MRQGKQSVSLPSPRMLLTGQSARKGAALSNAMAAQPFHGVRFCQCGRLADRLGCRRTRRHPLPATQ
jgi:hypothetical protein